MPTIAVVAGVRIVMYWNDHAPPHFHALLAEHRAVIEIDSLTVIGGYLPKHKLRSVLEWAASRQGAFHSAWRSTQALRSPGTIE
jgi:Domain of unknown function (DUF4160)